jgi:hypothetical protein
MCPTSTCVCLYIEREREKERERIIDVVKHTYRVEIILFKNLNKVERYKINIRFIKKKKKGFMKNIRLMIL